MGARLITPWTVTVDLREFDGEVSIIAPAKLGDTFGLVAAPHDSVPMVDGHSLKAGKLRNMSITRECHRRHHNDTGIMVNTLYLAHVAKMARDSAFAKWGVHWNWGNRPRPGVFAVAQGCWQPHMMIAGRGRCRG